MKHSDNCLFCGKECRYEVGSKVVGKKTICSECVERLKDIIVGVPGYY